MSEHGVQTWLVCGGRDFGEMPRGVPRCTPQWYTYRRMAEEDRNLLESTLTGLVSGDYFIRLVHGGARGADRLADLWGRQNGAVIARAVYPADWFPNGRSGGLDRSAGVRRNQKMLDAEKPDRVIAFPGGKGTADMVTRARAAGVEVIEIGRSGGGHP